MVGNGSIIVHHIIGHAPFLWNWHHCANKPITKISLITTPNYMHYAYINPLGITLKWGWLCIYWNTITKKLKHHSVLSKPLLSCNTSLVPYVGHCLSFLNPSLMILSYYCVSFSAIYGFPNHLNVKTFSFLFFSSFLIFRGTLPLWKGAWHALLWSNGRRNSKS